MSSSMQTGTVSNDTNSSNSGDSKAPFLSGTSETYDTTSGDQVDNEGKARKRDFFRFSKKNEEEKKIKPKAPVMPVTTSGQLGLTGGMRNASPLASASSLRSTGSPPRTHTYGSPVSPGRQRLQSASPRALSPSTSQIFERSVQEDVLPPAASPQIPSHIMTENHIPPALDASSEAITDSRLNPDTVEIVTHANHQPAAATLVGTAEPTVAPLAHEDLVSHVQRHDGDNVSNYGSLDVGDVRRLSFISFADVVHAEQEFEEQRRDSTPMASLSGHPALTAPRSPSPMRSPDSSQVLGTSPSTSVSASFKGYEMSPNRRVHGNASPFPGQASPLAVSELNIETMRQALRKTGSGDLSGFRSGSTSAVGVDN